MPHSFTANQYEAEVQTASGRSGRGGKGRGPATAAGILDMPEPPERTRMGKLMDRLRDIVKRSSWRRK